MDILAGAAKRGNEAEAGKGIAANFRNAGGVRSGPVDT